MTEFVKQDIFFFVTTVAVAIIAVVLTILIIYLISISRKVDKIVDRARQETDLIADDLDELRKNIKSEGAKLKHFGSFFSGLFRKRRK